MSEPTERDRMMAAECMPALLPGGISMPSRDALAEHFAQARAEGAREEREAIAAGAEKLRQEWENGEVIPYDDFIEWIEARGKEDK